MHVFIYALFIAGWKSPQAIGAPIASADTDYPLFSADDVDPLGTADDWDLFAPTDDPLSDLTAADLSCPADVSLWGGDDTLSEQDFSDGLVLRDLDETLLAGNKDASCVNRPAGSNSNPEPKLEMPQLLAPNVPTSHDGRCDKYGRSVLACCDSSKILSPTNCQAYPWDSDCKRYEYCCREIFANGDGNNCLLLRTPLQRLVDDSQLPRNWDVMPIIQPEPAPGPEWVNPLKNAPPLLPYHLRPASPP